MLNLMRSWIQNQRDSADSIDPEALVRQAVCALLLEIAHGDDRFTAAERDRILAVLGNRYDLSREQANELIAASRKALRDSTDLWQFARHINEHRSTAEKVQIIEALWRVIYADGKLDQHEDYLIHKMSTLLRLEHKQLIDAKLKVLAEMRHEIEGD
ncbi:MAG: hypothetical protein AUK55_04795 [Syntrophobacteraceae bacterium CG2_30_61_12]|nr:MAG: hypothetical protein AUK55_04795 [Syntrophobacteraceae bacterium CG2_30_61_12]PIU31158.1 MAG: hypothetical protein COT06_09710 [Syntrophobacteraceae bacterium CG07_land_8_20_14_0_80_61_8]